MHLHAHKARLLLGDQVLEMFSEGAVVPLVHEKLIGEHEQNTRASTHHVLDVGSVGLLGLVRLVVVEHIGLGQVIGLDERHQVVDDPVLVGLVVADEQVKVLVAFSAALARTAAVEARHAVEHDGEHFDRADAVDEYHEDEQEADESDHNAGNSGACHLVLEVGGSGHFVVAADK